jgi:hypothetical protein
MRELLQSRNHSEGYRHTDSITTSVTIRVTPGPDDFLVSWIILWAGFVILSMVATWQVIKENKIIASRTSNGSDLVCVIRRHNQRNYYLNISP